MNQRIGPVTARGQKTRQALLDAACEEFGTKGFYNASISSITRRAGVAQGTFYLYYRSKEEILRALVEHMNRSMRRTQSEAVQDASDRISAEIQGFRHFMRFALRHRSLYRVVMESQFVDPRIHRDYYQTLAERYARHLAKAQANGEIREGDPGTQAWALIGIAYFMGLRFPVWEEREPPDEVMDTLEDFITAALRPDPAAPSAEERPPG
ncbi:TetR/AcrR family transcriptional regulator [Alkalilimnicola ehrlichii MLHE-1]|uniref:Transcriptional regulator, TetR family n=1 Tax=Alkalilimnicola ehrlichii (strain ATCC BAA-1101 / DSM 17681 / MLHE-1) TaxID=187272 RepID=Q0A8N0_ALKEH|nr:TetR/AcrR family transcriptional regulator [Alkalilimnicola ehrlichii]ABI56807.1 transcriptional regulator, TetR family [Alkalilimnicola ehrlichii MLHE-1]